MQRSSVGFLVFVIGAVVAGGCGDDAQPVGTGGQGGASVAANGGSGGDGGAPLAPSPFCEALDADSTSCAPWEPDATCPAAEVCWRDVLRDEVIERWEECMAVYSCATGCEDWAAKPINEAANVEYEPLLELQGGCLSRTFDDCTSQETEALCERMRAYKMYAVEESIIDELEVCWTLPCGDIAACVATHLDDRQEPCGWTMF